jgi:hypothetical protein
MFKNRKTFIENGATTVHFAVFFSILASASVCRCQRTVALSWQKDPCSRRNTRCISLIWYRVTGSVLPIFKCERFLPFYIIFLTSTVGNENEFQDNARYFVKT